MRADSLWVPERIASALLRVGLGKEVFPCLIRTKAVRKSASSAPEERPHPADHYDSLDVRGRLSSVDEVVLIDDIVTRGATLMGAANKLLDVFPKAKVRAFAAIRTISNSKDFDKVYDPVKGTIILRPEGDTLRRP